MEVQVVNKGTPIDPIESKVFLKAIVQTTNITE